MFGSISLRFFLNQLRKSTNLPTIFSVVPLPLLHLSVTILVALLHLHTRFINSLYYYVFSLFLGAAGIPSPPDGGALAYVLRTGFGSSQGSLLQMIEFSQQSVAGRCLIGYDVVLVVFVVFLVVFFIFLLLFCVVELCVVGLCDVAVRMNL